MLRPKVPPTNFNDLSCSSCASSASLERPFRSLLSLRSWRSWAPKSSRAIFRDTIASALASVSSFCCSNWRCFTFCLKNFSSASFFSASSSIWRSLFLESASEGSRVRWRWFTWAWRGPLRARCGLFPRRFWSCPSRAGRSCVLPFRAHSLPLFGGRRPRSVPSSSGWCPPHRWCHLENLQKTIKVLQQSNVKAALSHSARSNPCCSIRSRSKPTGAALPPALLLRWLQTSESGEYGAVTQPLGHLPLFSQFGQFLCCHLTRQR